MRDAPTICIDFDGVLHSYSSGWQRVDVAADPPVPGAIEWLRGLIVGGQVKPVIYSSRSKDEAGIRCMKAWLLKHGLEKKHVDALEFPTEKPAAFVTIDDRAIRFRGDFDELAADDLLNYQPWNSPWPTWKRYAEDEASKWGMKLKPMKPDFDRMVDRVKVTIGAFEDEIAILISARRLHYSIVEPKVRGQVRLAALMAQRRRDVAAKRMPRPICGLHKCTHMPGEPQCEWEVVNSTWRPSPDDLPKQEVSES